ncbi:MAG: peptidyl-prolyl cis-trans isomerase, partial [Phycisphaerae bacterium]
MREHVLDPTDNDGAAKKRGPIHADSADDSAPHAAAATADAAGGVRAAESGGRRVLLVNDEVVTIDEILKPIGRTLEDAAERYEPRDYYRFMHRAVQSQIISEVAERLIYRKAAADITEDMETRLTAAVDRLEQDVIQREHDGRVARYEAALAEDGRTREDVRRLLRRRLVVQQYVRERLLPRVHVSRRELLRYYEEHPEEFSTPRRVEMFLIDIPLRDMLPSRGDWNDAEKLAAAREAARERLSEAHARIAEGEPFEKVARAYSKGLNADRGGRWGMITAPLKDYWEAPSRLALTMQGGNVSAVTEGPQCVFIVKVGAVEGGRTPSFEEAQPRIHEQVRQTRLAESESEFLQAELRQSTVGALEPFIQAVISAAPESKRL